MRIAPSPFALPRAAGWISLFLMLLFLVQGGAAMLANSQTFDEAVYFASGYAYWRTGDFRLNTEHPPLIKEICLLPVWIFFDLSLDTDSPSWQRADQYDQYRIGSDLLYRSSVDARMLLNLARLPNLLLGAWAVALVGWWTFRLWGPAAGLLAMAAASLEPTFVAHSAVLTTDVGWAVFGTASLYTAWEFCRSGSWKWLVGLGVLTGLALTSKYSAVSLIAILPVIMVSHLITGGRVYWLARKTIATESDPAEVGKVGLHPASMRLWCIVIRVLQILLVFFIVGCVALTVVWAIYFFDDPTLWWSGLKQQLRHQELGHHAWFWGEYSSTGWPEYFLVALGIKTQVATLVLVGASLLLFAKGRPLGRDGILFLVLPLYIFLSALFVARINIGVRHALHVYPLFFVLAGRVATIRTRRLWVGRACVGALVALNALSAWRICPYPIAYFNELVDGPRRGRHILSDSNLDWGQGLEALAEYVKNQGVDGIYLSYFGTAPPEYFDITYQYAPAFGPLTRPEPTRLTAEGQQLFAISDFNIKGIARANRARYAWLVEREPVATLAYSIYVYDITDDAEAYLELARVYLEEDMAQCAAWELEKVLRLQPDHKAAKRLKDTLSAIFEGDWGAQ